VTSVVADTIVENFADIIVEDYVDAVVLLELLLLFLKSV